MRLKEITGRGDTSDTRGDSPSFHRAFRDRGCLISEGQGQSQGRKGSFKRFKVRALALVNRSSGSYGLLFRVSVGS